MKLMLDGPHFAGENIAVNIVEQVEGEKQQNRAESGTHAGAWTRQRQVHRHTKGTRNESS